MCKFELWLSLSTAHFFNLHTSGHTYLGGAELDVHCLVYFPLSINMYNINMYFKSKTGALPRLNTALSQLTRHCCWRRRRRAGATVPHTPNPPSVPCDQGHRSTRQPRDSTRQPSPARQYLTLPILRPCCDQGHRSTSQRPEAPGTSQSTQHQHVFFSAHSRFPLYATGSKLVLPSVIYLLVAAVMDVNVFSSNFPLLSILQLCC